jgi:hypothetical protein
MVHAVAVSAAGLIAGPTFSTRQQAFVKWSTTLLIATGYEQSLLSLAFKMHTQLS